MNTIIKVSILIIIFNFTNFNPKILCANIEYNIHNQLDLQIANEINVPTESILILNIITADKHLKLDKTAITKLKSEVNISYSTEVLYTIPNLLSNQNKLSIPNHAILPVISNFIVYHDEIFGKLKNKEYYQIAKIIKEDSGHLSDNILYDLFHEWLINTNKQDLEEVAIMITSFLPLSKDSKTIGVLSSLSVLISQKQLFNIMNQIDKNNQTNKELIDEMNNLRYNILHPEQIEKVHVVH